MKTKRLLNWTLSLVMALTVFSIPTGAFAEGDGNGEGNEGGSQSNAVLAWCDWGSDEEADEEADEDAEVSYEIIAGDEATYDASKINSSIAFCKLDAQGNVIDPFVEDTEYAYDYKWSSSNPDAALLSVETYDENDEDYVKKGAAIQDDQGYIDIIPKSAGETTISVEALQGDVTAYTLSVNLTVTEDGVAAYQKNKFQCFLDSVHDDGRYFVDEADYDDREVTGSFDYGFYNGDLSKNDDYRIKASDFDDSNFEMTIAIGTQTINVKKADLKIKSGEATFTKKFKTVKLGTNVTATIAMGGATKAEKLVVSKIVEPKITAKNFVYNGRTHKTTATVKVGSTTLKRGTDYILESNSLKNVGRARFDVMNANDRTNKYHFSEFRYFKVNPKGTSLKKLKKAKKAFTATWAKQAAKMSKSRITGYQIQYSTSKKFTKKTTKLATVKGYSKTSKKIKKLKKKKTYYVRIRTYKKVGSLTYYSAWSKAKSVKTK